ncbi:retrovirus-related pol polyprotein from transposon TNT 1-94 [Tanacetum coccineum]|uniref:Retrovirus-related pol polyprotein from transposon TNT 1-94 n=1 Tax=Tanacetum coccineum TaxID=301880 RepID=A0ABQ4ZCX4_9ASTR
MSNTNLQTQTSNALHNAIMKAGGKDRLPMLALGIDNDIYSTVDACPNACEMWKAIERLNQVNVQLLLQLQPEWQRFVTLVKLNQELKTVSYHKLYNIQKQHQNEVNEIRAKRLARTANPLALVAQQQPVYHPQNHPTHNNQYSSSRSQQSTKNRGKAIVNSSAPIYDQEPATITEDDKMVVNVVGARKNVGTQVVKKSGIQCYNCKEYGHVSRECQKPKRVKDATYHKEKMLLCKQEEAEVQLNAEQSDWKDDTDDESDDQELEAHYMYMAQIQEVTPDPVDNSGPIFDVELLHKVQNNTDNYNVFTIENKHPEQPDSVNDIYLEEQGDTDITIDSLDICYNRDQDDQDDTDELDQERDLLTSLIEKLKCEIDDSKNRNKFLETSNKALIDKLKDLKKFQTELDRYHDMNYASKAQIKLYKTREDKELDKVIALENKVEVLDDIVYKTGQSVQTMNMLNHNCKMSFAKPEFLKKAQRANPRLYDIGCYNDNLALMLAPESDKMIRLDKESQSKLSDLIRPFDYDQLNNLYDLFVPQR